MKPSGQRQRASASRHRSSLPSEGRETGLRETLLKLDAIACHDHLPECTRKSPESLGRIMAAIGA